MREIDKVRNKIKNKQNNKKYYLEKTKIGMVNKFLIVILVTIITLIGLKKSTKFKEKFYKYVYNDHISFAYLNNLYQKYFGNPIPKAIEEVKPVFKETLTYQSKENYLDGVKLEVGPNYLVPTLNSGMVIFVGEKDGYGNTVVIEQSDGIEVWYSNITSNLKMYDYIEKGSNIGEANETLYLVFKKDGAILNYEDYI